MFMCRHCDCEPAEALRAVNVTHRELYGGPCLAVSCDEHVEFLVFSVVILRVSRCTLLHGPAATNGDLGVGLHLHPLLCVATRSDDQACTAAALVDHSMEAQKLLQDAIPTVRVIGTILCLWCRFWATDCCSRYGQMNY